tara:strand:- start:1582 stop:2727 length:1146 start_codon:yes stop_codon:yes gene_type:complete
MIQYNNIFKYFLFSLIPTSTYLYIIYEDYYSKSNVKIKDIEDLVKDKNETVFYKDILDKCDVNKNLCILSYEITKGAYDKITSHGITEYLNKIRENATPFETGDKEDVFVFQEHEDPNETSRGNLFTLYDNSSLLNQKYVADTIDDLNKLCGEGNCDLLSIMKQITSFCDKNPNGGFVEYYWFDPKTQQTISKRSFVIKINDVEYEGNKRDIYIGSGHAIEVNSRTIDYFKLYTTLGFSILFLLIFLILNLSKEFKSEVMENSVIFGAMVLFSLTMLDRYKTSHNLEKSIKLINNKSITSRILGALCASIAIFISLFKKQYSNSFYIIYVITLILLILSSIHIQTSDTTTIRNILSIKYISNIMITILLYIVFIFVIIVYK